MNVRSREKGKRRRGRRREERGEGWLPGALGWLSSFWDMVLVQITGPYQERAQDPDP